MRISRSLGLAGLACLSLLAVVAPAVSGPQKAAPTKTASTGKAGTACRFPLPAPTKTGEAAFQKKLDAFLEAGCYKPWTHDKEIRNTGPFIDGQSYGTHPAVRVYYSPEVMRWLREGRKGKIADGGMIVKEMYNPPASPDLPLSSWTVMVRDQQGSWDGWYWSYHGVPSSSGPSGDPQNPRVTALSYPSSGFGLYCINCHASADNPESTYSTLRNLTDDPVTYLVSVPTMDSPTKRVPRRAAVADPHTLRAERGPVADLQALLGTAAAPDFAATYGPAPQGDQAVKNFPVETFDHVVSGHKGPQQFITSDQCIGCHDATQNIIPIPPNMTYPAGAASDDKVTNLSPYGEWRASMMGLAGRDPVFYAQLESEVQIHDQKDLPVTIQNTCFRCHGVMGQRQLTIDSHGQKPFLQPMVYAAGHEPFAEYGALARDGVSCASCHHISPQGLGTPATFTGQFKTGPADQVYGPFEKPQAYPMKQALGMTPVQGAQVKSAALCGSCHAIKLPVYDAKGNQVGEDYEQATYLEWLNSVFQNERQPSNPVTAQTCQDCHMPTRFATKEYEPQSLSFRIAAIEDDTFPFVDNRAPNGEIQLAVRKPYSRHMLLGINAFVLQMFHQFWDPLGIRTADPMQTYGDPVPGLKTALDGAVILARKQSATVEVKSVTKTADGLEAAVQVTNLAGHDFPSGVGFRRAFIQLEVLDAEGHRLWVSGSTSPLGVILDGATGKPLPSEFFERLPDGQQAYQPHYEVIDRQDQVQIYEELVKDPQGSFTTSFVSLYQKVKENRLPPRGWSPAGPWAEVTKPVGGAASDPSYLDGSGTDTVTYRIKLGDNLAKAAHVRASLWYQATPPYYLMQRFTDAKGPDTHRLYVFTRDLKVTHTPVANWKLEIATASKKVG